MRVDSSALDHAPEGADLVNMRASDGEVNATRLSPRPVAVGARRLRLLALSLILATVFGSF
jgi:hypothetical protein